MSTSTTYVIANYTILAGVAAAGYYFYQNRRARNQPQPAQRRDARPSQSEPSRKDNKPKRQRHDAVVSDSPESSDKNAAKPKGKDKSKPKPAKTENTWPVVASDSTDDGVNNKEFAKQLSSAIEGTKLTNKGGSEPKKQKSVKQSKANAVAGGFDKDNVSAPSSTAGVDADDDQSSTLSPEVTAADAADVSDMLEPTRAGPSVLRIVNTDKVQDQKSRPAKAAEPVETKKQRQNRKKAEQAKALREETEKQRLVTQEQQRRLARISEGRPAKDGSQFMAQVNGSQPSAWAAGAPNGSAKVAESKPAAIVPLDTFESTANSDNTGNSQTSQSQNMTDSWISSLPSEEEQIEKLKVEAEQWNTVETKSKKGRKQHKADEPEQSAEKATEALEPIASKAAAEPEKKQQNGTKHAKPAKATRPTVPTGGSFAALSTDEVEWDV